MVVGKGKVWFDDFTLEAIASQEIKKDVESKDKVEAKKRKPR